MLFVLLLRTPQLMLSAAFGAMVPRTEKLVTSRSTLEVGRMMSPAETGVTAPTAASSPARTAFDLLIANMNPQYLWMDGKYLA